MLLMVAPVTITADLYLPSVLLRCLTLLGTIPTRTQPVFKIFFVGAKKTCPAPGQILSFEMCLTYTPNIVYLN